MTVIHELQQILWVTTPHGDGQVLFLMDYGVHENTIWIVTLEETGEIKHYNSNQLKICKNYTININSNDKR
jgi:hypothetical protein